MSGTAAVASLCFLAAAAGITLLQRLFPLERMSEPFSHVLKRWPLPIRPFLGPARLVAVLIAKQLPSAYCAKTRRRLEKADLHPGIDASQWAGLCICVTLATGTAAFLVTILAGLDGLPYVLVAAALAWIGCERWVQQRIIDCERRIVRDLPPCLDLLTLCVEAGATLTAAARFIVEQAPDGPLRNYFDRVLREVRSGRARAQAFASVADSYGVECLSTLASALSHAETAGMSIGQVLRTQAEQRSTERFVRAERQAMQAPVKMLGPLIFCIFPCTFIVLAVPIAYRLMEVFRT
jgi:tight adherence protein C